MLHSQTKIWIHLIWATKNRDKVLFDKQVDQIHAHIIKKSKNLKIPFEILDIQAEHIHGLINLPPNKLLSEFIHNIKGESSSWINKNDLVNGPFSWQKGYRAFSVSASQLETVKEYIKNQEEHHRNKSFSEEYENLNKEYGIVND